MSAPTLLHRKYLRSPLLLDSCYRYLIAKHWLVRQICSNRNGRVPKPLHMREERCSPVERATIPVALRKAPTSRIPFALLFKTIAEDVLLLCSPVIERVRKLPIFLHHPPSLQSDPTAAPSHATPLPHLPFAKSYLASSKFVQCQVSGKKFSSDTWRSFAKIFMRRVGGQFFQITTQHSRSKNLYAG